MKILLCFVMKIRKIMKIIAANVSFYSAIKCPRIANLSRIWGIRPDSFWSSTRSLVLTSVNDTAAVSIPFVRIKVSYLLRRLFHLHIGSFFYSPIVNNNFNSGQQVSAPARLSPHSPVGILPFTHPQPLSPRVTQVSANIIALSDRHKNRKSTCICK